MALQHRWQQCPTIMRSVIREVWARIGEDRLTLAAGAIAYHTLLSLIPLLLLALSLAAYVISPDQLQEQLRLVTEPLGRKIAEALLQEAQSVVHHRGQLTIVALILGCWTGSTVFMILEVAMNQAWETRKKRPYWVRRLMAFLMVLIIGTLLTAALGLANFIRFVEHLNLPIWGRVIHDIPWLTKTLVSTVIPFMLVVTIFMAVYRLLPTKNVTLRAVLPGALFAGLLWMISLHIFGWYAMHFTQYSLVYESLGSLGLLMLWFFYNALALLIGAEISASYHRQLLNIGDREEREVEDAERSAAMRDIPVAPQAAMPSAIDWPALPSSAPAEKTLSRKRR